jgi:DoxX-like family
VAKAYTLSITSDTMPFHFSGITKINIALNLLNILILISSLSFIGYGIAYFKSPQMKSEFKRFGLEKAGTLTAVLELLGAVGLLVGLKFPLILLISAGGLAILMFLGVAIRIKIKDSFWISLPALFFMILNAYIFFMSLPATM